MMTTGKRVTPRTAERLLRASYDLEYLANIINAEGFASESTGVRHVASALGSIGRSLDDKLHRKEA